MSQVCEICGDTGFPDLLFICNQCKGAEHLYCLLKQPDSDGEACWSCETCKLKQETITPGTVVSSFYSEIEQSEEKLNKCPRECQDSNPAIKKQALGGSDGTVSPNKKQELDSFDDPKSLPASKKQALESSNETDSLPKHKKKTLGSYSGIESLPINKKQNIESCNGIDSPSNNIKQAIDGSNGADSLPTSKKQAFRSSNCTDFPPASKMQALRSSDDSDSLPVNKKQEFESSNGTDFPQNRKKQVLKISNGIEFSLSRKKQVIESSDATCSLPSGKKQELEISKSTNSLPVSKKQELQSSKCMDSLLASKKQSPRSSNHTDSLLISKKEVVKSSFGTDSPLASEKKTPENSNGTSSFPGSKKQALGSVGCINPLPVRKKRVHESSDGTDSLPASKKHAPRSSNDADSLPARKKQATECSDDTDLSKESPENRSSSRPLHLSKAQMIPALVSSGSKNAMVDKSLDSSYPNALDSAKKSLRSSKEIGSESEQSSLHRNSSKSKITVECKMELKKLVPDGSMKGLKSTIDGPKLANKVFEKHKLSKVPESLLSMEVDTESSRGLLAKGNSSGYDVVSAGVTNNCKEIDQSLIGKSTVEDTITLNERDCEINNRSTERNSISQDMEKRKLDGNAVSWNNLSQRSLDENDKEKIGHSMINASEINLQSSSAMEDRSFNTCERGYMAGSMLSYTNCSSGTSLPHQRQLAMPQSLILWKGAFKIVDIACGHVIYGGIQAHPSTTASPKVYEMSKTFGSQLYLEQVHRAETWPKKFEQSPPTDDDVGLYFFPEDGKSELSFTKLVEYINKHDLAMRMHLDGAELLVFSSIQLPKYVQRIFLKFYLWGVFRRAEKSTTGHKLPGASMQRDHVRPDMTDSVAPSRRIDSQPAGLPSTCIISPLSLPLDSEVNHFWPSGIKEDTNGQDQLLPRIRSKVNLENCSEQACRRYSEKPIDKSREQYHWSGIEKVDGQSLFNLSDPYILQRHYSGKLQESMHERSNVHQSHEELNIGQLTPIFGSSNRIPIQEEKDEIELRTLQPQAMNIKSRFSPTLCPTDYNSRPSSSDHLDEKQGFMQFQVESNANAGARKWQDPRDQCHGFSMRSRVDRRHDSHQSSISSGDSDSSYENKGRSFSQPPAQRKIYKYKDINRFRKSQSFKDQIGTQTKRDNKEDRRNEDTKLGMERYRERSHRHWQTKDGRTHVQMENHRRYRERSHRHWQREDGRRHVQMENCRSPVKNNRGNSHFFSDSNSNKVYMLDETSMHRDSSSYLHEKTSMHRLSSNNHQIQDKNCVDKDKVYMVDNFRDVKHGISSIKRGQDEVFLLDVEKDCSVTQSGEASDQYQVIKDQQSFTQLHTATDEAAENNTVSEISNAASPSESAGQMYPVEIVPQILEADLPVTVNSRTEQTTTSELDQNPLLSHGNWYAGSSLGEADHEPVECLQLFPLEEENLGTTKNIVNEWDINLDLSLGRSSLKNVLKIADRKETYYLN